MASGTGTPDQGSVEQNLHDAMPNRPQALIKVQELPQLLASGLLPPMLRQARVTILPKHQGVPAEMHGGHIHRESHCTYTLSSESTPPTRKVNPGQQRQGVPIMKTPDQVSGAQNPFTFDCRKTGIKVYI